MVRSSQSSRKNVLPLLHCFELNMILNHWSNLKDFNNEILRKNVFSNIILNINNGCCLKNNNLNK